MKLKEALASFLLVDRAPQSRETYRKFLIRFVDAIGPERPLDLITFQDVDTYILDRRETAPNTPHTPDAAPSTSRCLP